MSKNFTQTIQFKGEFDISSILKSFKTLSANMKSQGVSDSLLGDVDSQIAKAEKSAKQLQSQIQKGFKNQSEINAFEKKMAQVTQSLEEIDNSFKEINSNSDNFMGDDLKDAKKNIENLRKQLDKLRETQEKTLKKNLQKLGFSDSQIKQISSQVTSQKDLNKALEDEYKKRVQVAQMAKQQYKEGMSNNNFYLSGGMAQGLSGAWKELFEEEPTQEEINDYLAPIYNAFERKFSDISLSAEEIWKAINNTNEAQLLFDSLDEVGNGVERLKEKVKDLVEERNNFSVALIGQTGVYEAEESKNAIGSSSVMGQFVAGGDATKALKAYGEQAAEIVNINNQLATSETTIQEGLQTITESQQTNTTVTQQAQTAIDRFSESMDTAQTETQELAEEQAKLDQTFGGMRDKIKNFLSLTAAINGLKKVVQDTFNDVKELDQAFASIAFVTDKGVAEMWDTYDQYASLANKLGQTTKDVVSSSALYIQQGLDTESALALTEQTAKLARLANIDNADATSYMTSAVRGFHMEMTEGARVLDVYSELAANAAADVHGIAEAMSRTASLASSAGMEFETTSALLTQMIETTQESAENLGTAMKTIIARFTELKTNVAGTSESEFEDLDVNRVDKALKSIGVQLKDTKGQIRDIDEVFLEVSKKWSTLDRNTQRYIATIAAGSRQQSRFIARHGRDMWKHILSSLGKIGEAAHKAIPR